MHPKMEFGVAREQGSTQGRLEQELNKGLMSLTETVFENIFILFNFTSGSYCSIQAE